MPFARARLRRACPEIVEGLSPNGFLGVDPLGEDDHRSAIPSEFRCNAIASASSSFSSASSVFHGYSLDCDRRTPLSDPRRLLERIRQLQHAAIVPITADDLHTHRQSIG